MYLLLIPVSWEQPSEIPFCLAQLVNDNSQIILILNCFKDQGLMQLRQKKLKEEEGAT